MELFFSYEIWISLITLTALEIVLGIDNLVFIALVVNHLKPAERKKARFVGLFLALFLRIALLLGISWILGLTEPFLTLLGKSYSGKDLMLLGGGLFLIYKATMSMHEEMTGDIFSDQKDFKGSFGMTIMQIIFIDFIFSFDSIITAVGLTTVIPVIVIAMVIAMIVMMLCSGYIADFIAKHVTLKILALAFILMIGVLLVGEGFGFHVPKGYIYFGMCFSLGVEMINMKIRNRHHQKSMTQIAAGMESLTEEPRAKKAPARKAPVRKPVVKKTSPKKAVARKSPAKRKK